MIAEMQSFFRTCVTKMKEMINDTVEGNPNVKILGFGDILYCKECEEVVNSVYHRCGHGTD